MLKSNRCYVVPVQLKKHHDADTLSIVDVDGYTVVVRTADFINTDRGVFIPPDSIVPQTSKFAFLTPTRNHNDLTLKQRRITLKKLRGVFSYGLLLPCDNSIPIGTDVTEDWQIDRYNPIEPPTVHIGDSKNPYKYITNKKYLISSPCDIPTYEIENFRKFGSKFLEKPVIGTEKIHGAFFRITYHRRFKGFFLNLMSLGSKRLFLGSKSFWRNDQNTWWTQALSQNKWIGDLAVKHPSIVFMGEIFGQKIQKELDYGYTGNKIGLRLFEGYNKEYNCYMDKLEFFNLVGNDLNIKVRVGSSDNGYLAPLIYTNLKCNTEKVIEEMSRGKSFILSTQIREGIVFTNRETGENLKLINPDYYEL